MTEASIRDILLKSFPQSGKNEWSIAASDEMSGKNSLENLSWQIDGITFNPYYANEDLEETAYLKKFHYSSHINFLGETRWQNIPEIKVIGEATANEKALETLMKGADGILFNVTHISHLDVSRLVDKIDWNSCAICFLISDTKMATDIFSHIANKNYAANGPTGSMLWNSFDKTADLTRLVDKRFEHYSFFGIDVESASPVQEISAALLQAVHLIDIMTDLGIDRQTIFRSVSLAFTCDDNFFATIGKLKAMRVLWYQLSQSFEINGYLPQDLRIHCKTSINVEEKFQPHGMLLKNTLQAAAAIFGGCDALTVSAEGDTSMTHRVALNVSNILKEESHFELVADPLAGSYAVENIVHEISKAGWNEFKKNLRT